MSKLKILVFLALSGLLFWACSDDDGGDNGFTSKTELKSALVGKWDILNNQSDYKSFEFLSSVKSKATAASPDGSYVITKKDGKSLEGEYYINDDLKTIRLTDLGMIDLILLKEGILNFTLTLTDGSSVSLLSVPAEDNEKTMIYAIAYTKDDEIDQIIEINPATGEKSVFIDNIEWVEYIDYYAAKNELIGITEDNSKYYVYKINLATKATTKLPLDLSNNGTYNDFVIVDDDMYVLKTLYTSSQGKEQLVKVNLISGEELVVIDGFIDCEYITYNSATEEIVTIIENGDGEHELYSINIGSKDAKSIKIKDSKSTYYDDMLIAEGKLFAIKSFDKNSSDGVTNQLVAINLASAGETIHIDDIEECEYIKYNLVTSEIIGLTELNNSFALYKMDIKAKTTKSIDLKPDNGETYNDFIIVNK